MTSIDPTGLYSNDDFQKDFGVISSFTTVGAGIGGGVGLVGCALGPIGCGVGVGVVGGIGGAFGAYIGFIDVLSSRVSINY